MIRYADVIGPLTQIRTIRTAVHRMGSYTSKRHLKLLKVHVDRLHLHISVTAENLVPSRRELGIRVGRNHSTGIGLPSTILYATTVDQRVD